MIYGRVILLTPKRMGKQNLPLFGRLLFVGNGRNCRNETHFYFLYSDVAVVAFEQETTSSFSGMSSSLRILLAIGGNTEKL